MKSRFLNVSPRAYIRQKDSVNTLPPIVRTGYQNETGKYTAPFDDNKSTLIFKNSQSLLAPYMISDAQASDSGFLTGSLVVTASLKDTTAYLEKEIVNPKIFPFKEGSNPTAYLASAEGEGFPAAEYPGFSAHDKDKTALVFDISTTSNFDILKLNKGDSNVHAGGPFAGREGSGFLYYDHEKKSWEDIGLRDPATGVSINYDPVFKLDHPLITNHDQNLIIGGSDTFLCQFASSPYSIVSELPYYVPATREDLEARGYHRIGEPTSFFEAPYAPRYHATTGSSLKLSDYISHPFVVDRISVNIPVSVFRTQSPKSAPSVPDFGFGRDIDNYVFFVYVQNRSNALKDSKQDVSSSVRYLIAKESLCVYNQNTLDYVSPGIGPIHSFGKSISFSMSDRLASNVGATRTQSRNSSINFSFRPQTFNNYFGATSKLAGSEDDPAGFGGPFLTGSVFIQNFWRGGQVSSGSLKSITIQDLTTRDFLNLNIRNDSSPDFMKDLTISSSPRALISSHWSGQSGIITSGSGLSETLSTEAHTVSNQSPSRMTPIILFPDDELVFGIDAGINPNMPSPNRLGDGVDQSVLDLTGSRLVINQGDAQVVLYGSLIKEKVQVLPSLNQYLGSDAVHEDVKEAGPYDQFDIYDKRILSSSYVDNFIGGALSTTSATRRIHGRGTSFQMGLTGSLQRNIRLQFENQLYHDTFLPAPTVIAKDLKNTSVGLTVLTRLPALVMQAESGNGYVVENNRSSNIMLNRPFTYEKEQGEARVRDVRVQLLTSAGAGGSPDGTATGDNARFLLYYNGSNSTVSVPTTINKTYRGASSLRYGLLSTRLIGPSCVFRRDRFGQFRDMLEQGRDGKIVTTQDGKDVVGTSVVVAKFVKQQTSTEVDPNLTQCSNLSTNCTSSIPFIDSGEFYNRGALPTTTTVSFGPNNLIFGVTGSFGLQ